MMVQRYEKRANVRSFFRIFLVSLPTDTDTGTAGRRGCSGTALRLAGLRATDTTLRSPVTLGLRLLSSLYVLWISIGNAVEGVFLLRIAADVLVVSPSQSCRSVLPWALLVL